MHYPKTFMLKMTVLAYLSLLEMEYGHGQAEGSILYVKLKVYVVSQIERVSTCELQHVIKSSFDPTKFYLHDFLDFTTALY